MIAESFNENWYVTKVGTQKEPIGPVTVPYDAMLFEARDPACRNGQNTGFFPGGVYRYAKTIDAPEQWRDRSVTLEFEGVYLRSEVFVNGVLAGARPSGYATFHVAIDALLKPGEGNLIEVIAHNDLEPNSRWYSGSGIYRPVHVLVGDRLHITPRGLRVTTRSLDGSTALVDVSTEVTNDSDHARTFVVATGLTNAVGRTVEAPDMRLTVAAGATATARQVITVPDADLWSPQNPHLHRANVRLVEDDQTIDEASTEFGIRIVAVDARRGLRINGEVLKLRGACIHHDNGVIGAHTLDAAEERRVRILKESGFNAIRSAHNPISSALLRACDRHGVLVMDEFSDAWRRAKSAFDYSRDFEQWWERDLEALVAKDVNHPSVILYSIGNEISETATPRGIELNRALAERTRELDPTRLVTNGINGFLNMIATDDDEKIAQKEATARESGENPMKNLIAVLNLLISVLEKILPYMVRLPRADKRTRDAFADLDVAGYNYMIGRYRSEAKRYPDRVIVGTETAPTETVEIWHLIKDRPNIIGDFTWTGWDYIGEAGLAAVRYNQRRQLVVPYPALLAGEPVIDITGNRQTQSYLNEIAWGLRSRPHLAVRPVNHSHDKLHKTHWRNTDSIRSWSWAGCEGRTATVEVYADAHEVQLLLDDTVVGTARAGRKHGYLATFTLAYRAGTLTAIARTASGEEIGRDSLTSAGPELRISVQPETAEIRADGADLAYVPIELTDAQGILRPLSDRPVTVEVTGPGRLLGFGSAEPITEEAFSSNRHTTYWGRALAVVRAGHEAGEITVTATAEGCEAATAVIQVRLP